MQLVHPSQALNLEWKSAEKGGRHSYILYISPNLVLDVLYVDQENDGKHNIIKLKLYITDRSANFCLSLEQINYYYTDFHPK